MFSLPDLQRRLRKERPDYEIRVLTAQEHAAEAVRERQQRQRRIPGA
jgi:hypothetical protein